LTAAASWAATGAWAFSAAGRPHFVVFLAGRPGDFFELKKDAILARPCAASAASVFGFFLKGGIFGAFLPTDRRIEKFIIFSGGKNNNNDYRPDGTTPHISWHTSSLSLLLAASVACSLH
jgi:hypothetical protein